MFYGDSAFEFIRRVGGKYDFIYGFKPEFHNFEKAKLSLAPYKDIEIIIWTFGINLTNSFSCG
ncbi:hypothetical protein HMPREF0322_04701 [Desulfitobacterium hafniense DP7]|uniref:Uncharacterized protein n=1 Tax=Desulfitobacterium hafniense DP7 TaxID=537010 RepID=G9XUP2_DESHA|nr:hypothetical protein HMPREF0322_04701 [Desulfitobacterium hafniense DP7]